MMAMFLKKGVTIQRWGVVQEEVEFLQNGIVEVYKTGPTISLHMGFDQSIG